MKKICLLLLLIILTGCSSKEKIFEEYAKQYYQDHMKMVNNIESVTITLSDLKTASAYDEYDLSKLKKCKDNSKIIFYLNKDSKNIENKKIELDC